MGYIELAIEYTTIIYIWGVSTKEIIGLWLIQKKLPGCFMPFFKKLFKGLDKRVDSIRRLRSDLNELKEYPFNTNHEHYLNYLEKLQLVNYSKFPQGIEEKVNRYNKKAADLSDLFIGCDRFVQDMIIKNSLEYLHEIEIIRDVKGQIIPWELGYEGDTKLSQLLAHVLKDRILKNEKINKPLFDSTDPRFYKVIEDRVGGNAFPNFIRSLNKEIEVQEKYGCLKLFKRCYGETKEYMNDLLDEVSKYKV